MTTVSTVIIVGIAPPERVGAASSISEMSSEFGGALGIAILGSIGTAMYRSEVATTLPATATVNPRAHPKWVGLPHRSSQRADVSRRVRPPDAPAIFPPLEQADALTIPG
jgi:hypothetical protein